MYCSNCGYQAKDADKFCANCGQPLEKPDRTQFVDMIEEETQPVKRKKKKKSCLGRFVGTLIMFWLIVFFAIGLGGSDDSESPKVTATTKPTATSAAASTATPTVKPTATPTVKPTAAATPTVKIDKSTLVTLAKTTLEESASAFSYCKVDGDETGFTVSVALDGLAFELAMYQEMGKDINEEGWQTVKNNMVFAYNSARALLDGIGLSDAVLMMNLLNDNNHDYTLLSVYGGQIVYDFAAQ